MVYFICNEESDENLELAIVSQLKICRTQIQQMRWSNITGTNHAACQVALSTTTLCT